MVFEGRATTQTKNAKFAFFEKIQALGFPFLRKGMKRDGHKKSEGIQRKGVDRTVFCICYYRETNSVLRGNF
jgi:hypothetical protein